MENQPFDAQALMSRASEITKDIRKSDAYPALIGGIAGAVAGGLIAALIAGRVASSRNSVFTSWMTAASRESART